MEWFWDVLNCEPTKEIYKIKQAYVKQVKDYKQLEIKGELAADAYDRLDEAEKSAIAFIEGQRDSGSQQRSAVPVRSETPEKVFVAPTPTNVTTNEKTATPRPISVAKKSETSKPVDNVEKQEMSKLAQVVKEVQKAKEKLPKPSSQEQVTRDETASAQVKRPVAVLVVDQIRALLNNWPDKINLTEWEAIFKAKSSWEREAFVEIRDNSLPLISKQRHLLPKTILHYLYEELEIAQIELTGKTNWFYEIDRLPDFSFEQALYIPRGMHDVL